MSCNKLSSTQLAIISAVVMVIGDVISLIAALAAYDEEQQSKEETKREPENKINDKSR